MKVAKNYLMQKTFWFLAVASLLFLSSNLSVVLGITSRRTVAIMPIIIYMTIQILRGYFKWKNIPSLNKSAVIFGFICIIYVFINPRFSIELLLQIITFTFIPFIIYAYMEQMQEWEKEILKKCIILLLLLEFGIALYERLTYSILFQVTDEEVTGFNNQGDTWSFRSMALFGHSLANALIITTISLFLLSSKEIKLKHKFILWICSFISLLCFNSRGNIIIFLIGSLPFLYSYFKNTSLKNKALLFLFIIIGFFTSPQLEDLNLGGRLLNQKISTSDSSTMARFEAFDIFQYADTQMLFWGSDTTEYLQLMYIHTQASWVENGFLVIILQYGCIIGIPLIILLLRMQWKTMKSFHKLEKTVIITAFIVIGMSNPQMAIPIQWMVFFFSCYAFRSKQYKLFFSKHDCK